RSFRRKAWQLRQVHSVTSLHLWASAPGAAGVRVWQVTSGSRTLTRDRPPRQGANVDYPLTRAELCDSQRIYDPFELLADAGGKAGCRRPNAADLAATVEVVCAVERHILGWLPPQKEQGNPEHSGILLVGATAYPFHTRVVRHMLFLVEHLPAFY